jgi:hypothetical protein
LRGVADRAAEHQRDERDFLRSKCPITINAAAKSRDPHIGQSADRGMVHHNRVKLCASETLVGERCPAEETSLSVESAPQVTPE